MALTVASLQEPRVGSFQTVTEVTFDNSYAEGGEAFTPADAGLSSFDFTPLCFVISGSEAEANPVNTAYYKEEKLHLIDGKTSKEMAKEKDMSKVKVLVLAAGKTRAR